METHTTASTATPQTAPCAPMSSPPRPEHAWLQKLLGNWTFETECSGAPGEPNEKFRGTEKVKSIGDLWIVGEGQGEMPGGGTGKMMITLGFDPNRNRFVGTWVGSMMHHLWVYEGELDSSGCILTLSSDGPHFTDPKKVAKYQDIIEIKNDDQRTLSSRVLGDDGNWTQFMTGQYRRTE